MPIIGVIASSIAKATGGYDSIASAVVTSTSVSFTNIPASTYAWLEIRLSTFVADGFYYRFNADASNIYFTRNNRYTGGANALPFAQSTAMTLDGTGTGGSGTYPAGGIIRVGDYRSGAQYKSVNQVYGDGTGSSTVELIQGGGLWQGYTAINRIDIIWSNNASNGSKISLYGMRGTII